MQTLEGAYNELEGSINDLNEDYDNAAIKEMFGEGAWQLSDTRVLGFATAAKAQQTPDI